MDPDEQLLVTLGGGAGAQRDVVGAKAAVLSVLADAGYRVPAGFVVTAGALEQLGDGLDVTLLSAVDRLGGGPFAVRSSAGAEDLPDASFAGVYETYLNVDREGIGPAVRRCFASAASYRVSAYRSARLAPSGQSGSAGQPVGHGMAVLVQQMVSAVAAGVAFTANPLTGDRGEVVLSAVRGLGEPLVGGEAIGEQWVVRGRDATRTRAGEGVLSVAHAVQVADMARRVESRLGVPQDIEWAIDARQRVHLLQARPMTAIPDPVQWAPPGAGMWTRNFRLGEWLPEAMTPLFADWLLHRIEAGYLDGMRATARVSVPFRYAAINGWYYNATPIPSLRLLVRVLRDSRGRAPWLLYNVLVRVSRDPVAADRAVLSDLATRWREHVLPAYRHLVHTAGQDLEQASCQQLVAIIDQLGASAGEYLGSLAIVGGSAWKIEGALGRFWRRYLAEPLADTPAGQAGPQGLLRGLPGAQPTFPTHAVYSLDWYHPTAAEAAIDLPTMPALPEPGLAATRTQIETTCRAVLQPQPKLLARFEGLLAVAQRYAVIREEQARDFTLAWPLLRRCAHRLGQALVDNGGIAQVDDIFFLTLAEVTDQLAGTANNHAITTTARRARWRGQCRLIAPLTLGKAPRLMGDPIGRAVAAARTTREPPANAVIGHPASAGRATGAVRIVEGPADLASFANGEVLVAKATAPAWTPLFARAVAVVTDGGTLAAHASLVAREYGIPAVVGTGDATSRLHTGQRVTVDGNAGTVQLADSHPTPPP
ncbi:MAG: PEP/pyruvate-binding domain-containing protein [Dermatophilaceae bacterium]